MKLREKSAQKRRKRRKSASSVEQLLLVVALTFANQICDISATPMQLQQQLGYNTSIYEPPSAPAALSIQTQATTKRPRQSFRHRPGPTVNLTEGNTILLRCEVDNQAGDTQWLKDGSPVFLANRRPANSSSSERRNIVGSVERGEHNLELVNARLEDSGLYECQVQPTTDEDDDQLCASVQVFVRPQSQQQQQLDSQQQQQQDNKLQQKGALGDPISLTKLPRGAIGSTSSLTSASTAHFLTHQSQQQYPHPHQQQQSLPGRTPFLAALRLGWPYILLGFAGLLMLANIYLIYSLFRRHRENQRANSKCPEGSLGSSTVASSGSPLVSSSQSTESAPTTTTEAATNPGAGHQQHNQLQQQQQQQQLQFQFHQQQLQLQLQQQLQQLRPPISSSCDLNYDCDSGYDCENKPRRLQIRPDSSLRV